MYRLKIHASTYVFSLFSPLFSLLSFSIDWISNEPLLPHVHTKVCRFPSVFITDCTYKTNVYGLPLFQIVGVSSVHSSFLAASVFLRHETQVDFEWALQCFRQVLGVHEPLVFVTDKDMALVGSLRAVMPDTAHMLCIWHINKNVLSHHKILTSQFLALGVSEAAAPYNFMTDYAALVRATTEQLYEEKLAEMRARGGQVYQATLRYVEAEWLPHREKFVRARTFRNRHFNNAASSRAEGMNNIVKGVLGRRQGSITTVGAALLHVLADQWRVHSHDGRVLDNAMSVARTQGRFVIPDGMAYLADAGYALSTQIIVPFRGTRYHLREIARGLPFVRGHRGLSREFSGRAFSF